MCLTLPLIYHVYFKRLLYAMKAGMYFYFNLDVAQMHAGVCIGQKSVNNEQINTL